MVNIILWQNVVNCGKYDQNKEKALVMDQMEFFMEVITGH